jgi:Fe-S-cluster containining protein
MLQNFKQFVPSNVCLNCDGCCRFKQSDSRWRPHMTKEEQRIALESKISGRIFDKLSVSADERIGTISCSSGFLCRFFKEQDHTCGIYSVRPFECQLYPFLLGKEGEQTVLYVHLNCPYVQEHWGTSLYKEYASYLQKYFQQPEVKEYLRNNSAVFTDYSAYCAELDYVGVISLE